MKADHKIYVQVPVMFTEASMNQAVDVHTSNITCKILVCLSLGILPKTRERRTSLGFLLIQLLMTLSPSKKCFLDIMMLANNFHMLTGHRSTHLKTHRRSTASAGQAAGFGRVLPTSRHRDTRRWLSPHLLSSSHTKQRCSP